MLVHERCLLFHEVFNYTGMLVLRLLGAKLPYQLETIVQPAGSGDHIQCTYTGHAVLCRSNFLTFSPHF